MINLVMIDMDGVCTNFLLQACRVFEKEDVYHSYPKGESIHQALRVSVKDFWKKIDKTGEAFWTEMEEMPYFRPILSFLENKKIEWMFCTKPTLCATSCSGKLLWIQKKFSKHFRNFQITPQKWPAANKNTLLIDDHKNNTVKFESRGGHTILVPSIDNEFGIVDVKHVMDQLDIIL